jgi:hypothetical protein
LIFWMVGIAAWLSSRGVGRGWSELEAWVTGRSPAYQILLLIVATLLVVGSAAVMRSMASRIIRALEGYWLQVPPLPWVRERLETRARNSWGRLRSEYRTVLSGCRSATLAGTPDPVLERRRADLEDRLHRRPGKRHEQMPTKLGNVLRAAELRPIAKYGIDPVSGWPAFWLVLPSETRTMLTQARQHLDGAALSVAWACMCVVWSVLAWWAAPVAVVAAVAIYRGQVLRAAESYADLLEASFDVYRWNLYDALRLRRPARISEERTSGRLVTALLWRPWDPATADVPYVDVTGEVVRAGARQPVDPAPGDGRVDRAPAE